MFRPFVLVTLALTAVMAFLLGVTSGSLRAPVLPDTPPAQMEFAAAPSANPPISRAEPAAAAPALSRPAAHAAGLVNFADVAESINPAVVNIEATTRAGSRRRRGSEPSPFDDTNPAPQSPNAVRPQSGSGFVIEADGQILTNYHVIQNAERIMVKFSDGRSLHARVLGIDPDTDIALIKVDAKNLPVAPMGDSETLRVGEWVCAIGNPLAYEHTVTVGVVSYLGRKLFDSSLDNYIQTDAAINFGNSGGPLINGQGEVVGINSAISQRASNIGFAVPINEARAILPQLRTEGRVSRGYMGVEADRCRPGPSALAAAYLDARRACPGRHQRVARTSRRTARLRSHHRHRRQARGEQQRDHPRSRAARPGNAGSAARHARRPQPDHYRAARRASNRQAERALDETNPVRPSSNAVVPLGLSVRDLDRDTSRRLRLPERRERGGRDPRRSAELRLRRRDSA